jgi:hypothetical protein
MSDSNSQVNSPSGDCDHSTLTTRIFLFRRVLTSRSTMDQADRSSLAEDQCVQIPLAERDQECTCEAETHVTHHEVLTLKEVRLADRRLVQHA